ncbi:hypothetical protein AUK04_01610 [Candidatus Roizmanbacteria bacterium CG2_30_33_16]|uniref:Nucleotidyl transferase domain-containing protein n=1 Tax=Candidatus Roizmanbacteria bacterium CG2_30_33_16 TaxID=1805340 RepID=A0A1J5HIN2_9BACT|nr:MAG: hypothetical protein AUK04_01610 [Candidatus Roizmanbacteria bacterium CG2_30_33_16]
MKPEISAVVLAGRLGSRMNVLTKNCQKSMLGVEGQPILHYIFEGLQSEFGSAKVVIATGYRGEDITKAFGNRYRNIHLEYVHDSRHLEVRKRLLLADGLLEGPFFVMGTDVTIHSSQYSNMVQIFNTAPPNEIYGVISGAIDIKPAPTHALISTEGNKVIEIQTYPPFDYTNPSLLRDMSLWYFDQRTLHLLKEVPSSELNISPVLNEAIKHGVEYMIEKYHDNWYHFATPEDLQVHINFHGIVDAKRNVRFCHSLVGGNPDTIYIINKVIID